jgi:hypothetical protein
MPPCGYVRPIVVAILLLAVKHPVAIAADQRANDWLRGSGEDLQIRLNGEVFYPDGKPANEIQVASSMMHLSANEQLRPKIDGHRFEMWIPVNKSSRYSMWLKAASADDDLVAYKQLSSFELRQAAIDGIKLTLQSPTRHVEVKVVERGQPVADAIVKADLGYGIELRSRTDVDGTARFDLLPDQRLSGLMAWTEDRRLGGYSFDSTPRRDPHANEHIIELTSCRDQKLRFVDDTGSPVPGVEFVIQMATAPPDYNYLGTNELSTLTTDAAGEVTYRWFPDWDQHHFYVDVNGDKWFVVGKPEASGDAIVFQLKRRKVRKHVQGRVVANVTSAGGFYVSLRSFQGERENYSDITTAFSDGDGRFTVDVLPDATYCAYVLDSRWVGQIIDVIPYQSASGLITPPELKVSAGQPVEVLVTSGPKKRPYPNLPISFQREYAFTWGENGETRHGTGGPQWWATTDESGRAITYTLPGTLNVSVYTPLWRPEVSVNIADGQAKTIRLHREAEEKQRVTGRLVLADGLESELKDAYIKIGSLDGDYSDEQIVTCNAAGSFTFETLATEIGVFACTQDGRSAGSSLVKDFSQPIEVYLRPTASYDGALLGADDQPLAGHRVSAIVRVQGEKKQGERFPAFFEAKRIELHTDHDGNFRLEDLPSGLEVNLYADSIDGSDDSDYLADIYLEPGEKRPRTISRLEKETDRDRKLPLAERFNSTLRDCDLSGFRLMLIVASDTGEASQSQFVNQNFIDPDTNSDIYSFMQIVVSGGQIAAESADAAFLHERGWPLPDEGRIVAHAIDGGGQELGRLEINVADSGAAAQVADFIHRHAPPRLDAEKKWNEAFVEANLTNRRVWARVSQRYCGPCFSLTRWLDDQHELLNKDYVMLKIDDVRDANGARVAERLTRGAKHGIPFHAIFDQDGQMLIDSVGPLGNIGSAAGIEGTRHLRKMLLETRRNLTDAEIDRLVESPR